MDKVIFYEKFGATLLDAIIEKLFDELNIVRHHVGEPEVNRDEFFNAVIGREKEITDEMKGIT